MPRQYHGHASTQHWHCRCRHGQLPEASCTPSRYWCRQPPSALIQLPPSSSLRQRYYVIGQVTPFIMIRHWPAGRAATYAARRVRREGTAALMPGHTNWDYRRRHEIATIAAKWASYDRRYQPAEGHDATAPAAARLATRFWAIAFFAGQPELSGQMRLVSDTKAGCHCITMFLNAKAKVLRCRAWHCY